MYGDHLRYHLLVALIIMLLLLMMQHCIRQKYNVFDIFKKWKALVENETGKRLKCLRSDMEVNIATRILMITGQREYISRNTTRKWCVRKDEQDNHGAWKEYEIACWFSLIVLGRCCRYCYLLNKQRTFNLFGW
jgi:hypothetical protein